MSSVEMDMLEMFLNPALTTIKWRHELKLTQRKFALFVGVSHTTVVRIEAGKDPSLKVISQLASFYATRHNKPRGPFKPHMGWTP